MNARRWIAATVMCALPVAAASAESMDEQSGVVAYASDNELLTASYGCGDVCDCSSTCGDTIVEFGRGGSGGEGESCLDGFLPRSHLPFPLMEELAEGTGVTLPPPLGVSFVWTEMKRHVAVSDVRLGLGNNPPTSANRVSVPTTDMHASAKLARVDLWVLPFLNLYGLVGNTRSFGDVAVVVDRFPLPNSPPVSINVPIDIEGTTAGWGATSGIGSKDWFAMVDVNQTWTDFSQLNGSLTALVVTPRVGLVLDRPHFKGEVHVGAMWQDTAQTVDLTLNHPLLGPGLHVQVDQYEPNPWNFLVGGMWALDERLQLIVEGGMGGRSYIMSGITVRF